VLKNFQKKYEHYGGNELEDSPGGDDSTRRA